MPPVPDLWTTSPSGEHEGPREADVAAARDLQHPKTPTGLIRVRPRSQKERCGRCWRGEWLRGHHRLVPRKVGGRNTRDSPFPRESHTQRPRSAGRDEASRNAPTALQACNFDTLDKSIIGQSICGGLRSGRETLTAHTIPAGDFKTGTLNFDACVTLAILKCLEGWRRLLPACRAHSRPVQARNSEQLPQPSSNRHDGA